MRIVRNETHVKLRIFWELIVVTAHKISYSCHAIVDAVCIEMLRTALNREAVLFNSKVRFAKGNGLRGDPRRVTESLIARVIVHKRHHVWTLHTQAAGVYKGLKQSVDAERVRELKAAGTKPAAIARELGISRASVYLALKA